MTMGANKALQVDTTGAVGRPSDGDAAATPGTAATTPPASEVSAQLVRGSDDIRSPGIPKTPTIADFITQTDRFGNATTPRSEDAILQALNDTTAGGGGHVLAFTDDESNEEEDASDKVLDSFRRMCCCLIPEQQETQSQQSMNVEQESTPTIASQPAQGGSPERAKRDQKTKLLPPIHPDDKGKKCLVLDLDETLVHSSFRSVPQADFVIPVQIENVVHFIYVAKRPGVDEFLVEMAKHYEIIVYTASLNKYADPLLDLLDPHGVIRTRLFRESCVFFEGNYVKDLSLLNRDLKQSIIIDNSASSYLFHPENAIDCSSFIDDPNDRELEHIGAFLIGIKDSKDVRGLAPKWRQYPKPLPKDSKR